VQPMLEPGLGRGLLAYATLSVVVGYLLLSRIARIAY